MMTRKDYVETAKILSTLVENVCDEDFTMALDIVDQFSDMFAKDNARFHRITFLKACGIQPLEVR